MESRRIRISLLLVLAAFAVPLLNGCAVVDEAKTATAAIVKLQKSRQKRNVIATSMDDRVRRAE